MTFDVLVERDGEEVRALIETTTGYAIKGTTEVIG